MNLRSLMRSASPVRSSRGVRAAAAPYDRAARPTRRPAGGARVFVGNLDWSVSWQDLKDHMKRAGDVVHADVMMEPGSTRSKGCGIVEFANVADAKRAIATLTDTDLKGRLIFVREDREAPTAPALAPAAARAGIPPPPRGGGPRGGGGGARVYVGNLDWSVAWQDLKDHMKRAGDVVHADVMTEPGTGRSKGCGIVEYADMRDAKRAIATLTDTDLKGRLIFVREDREAPTAPALAPAAARAGIPPPPRGGGPRGGGGGARVFVGNLDWSVAWQDLKDHMKRAGDVVHADVMMEPGSTRSKGCGIVEFANVADAKRAIETLTDTDLKGRLIFVREDREATTAPALAPAAARAGIPPPVGGPRGGGGGGGGGGEVSVFVGNLDWDVSWQDLKDAFRAAGDVTHADVAVDSRTGRSRGFGTVKFADALSAGQAIRNLNGKMLRGRAMEVREDRK